MSSPRIGLSSKEAKKKLETYGPNRLAEKKRKPPWILFLEQFKDFMVLVLIAAAIVSIALG